MGELQYAQASGATRIFFYVQTFIGNWTNGEESFDSHPLFGLTRTGTASLQSPTPMLTTSNNSLVMFVSHSFTELFLKRCKA